ncbi:hypothetical protein SLEP1_g54788 [Rubroshorea leprosula]|uniref:Uncharacterized protein n=1 Tax=Rubroshorea leprosula TaxID=152421 RepID=A0AAV5MHJ3_9ROSI|nr:hypothetical protein SLEP1_g54788 [Rubroshorea leprosula]
MADEDSVPYINNALFARQEPVLNSSKYTAADVRIMSAGIMFLILLYRFSISIISKLKWHLTFRKKHSVVYGDYCFLRKRETRVANLTRMMTRDRKKEAEIKRENQVGTETEEIAVTEAAIMIVGAEIVTGIVIEIVIRIMSALELMILEVTTGHVQGLGNTLGIMIATGVTDTRCMNAAQEENEYETVLAYVSQLI